MKNIIFSICLFLLLASPSKSNIINGSFENGVSGWSVNIKGGSAYLNSSPDIVYTLDQIPDLFSFGVTPDVTTSDFYYQATDGNNLLHIEGNEAVPYHWRIDDDDFEWELYFDQCTISVSQSVYLKAGNVVSGDIAFSSSEVPIWNYDRAFVEITGPGYKEVPAEITVSDVFFNYPEVPGKSGWQTWSWDVPYDGLFQIALCNAMDVQETSDAYFDNIRIRSVPEPNIHLLFFTSMFLLILLKRADNKNKRNGIA